MGLFAKLLAAAGLRAPIRAPARPEHYLWADADLRSLYYGVNKQEAPRRPALAAGEWERIDATIDRVIARLDADAGLRVAFVLTEDAIEERSSITYVFFEPLANIVVALSHRERDISISADSDLWSAREDDFRRLTNHVEHLLQDGRLVEALSLAAEGLSQIFLPSAP